MQSKKTEPPVWPCVQIDSEVILGLEIILKIPLEQ